jgi:hypothetical protein
MLNDFLPAIVSLGILVGAFLFAWISDVRRIQRLSAPERDRNLVPASSALGKGLPFIDLVDLSMHAVKTRWLGGLVNGDVKGVAGNRGGARPGHDAGKNDLE